MQLQCFCTVCISFLLGSANTMLWCVWAPSTNKCTFFVFIFFKEKVQGKFSESSFPHSSHCATIPHGVNGVTIGGLVDYCGDSIEQLLWWRIPGQHHRAEKMLLWQTDPPPVHPRHTARHSLKEWRIAIALLLLGLVIMKCHGRGRTVKIFVLGQGVLITTETHGCTSY